MSPASSSNLPDSPNELFDLVDQSDHVIGQVRRGDAHRDPSLIHRCIQILVFNKDGRLLLQRRSMTKDMFPGFYTSSASGHVRSGEDYNTAAEREIQEELGIVPQLTYVGKVLARSEFETEMTAIFATRYDGPFSFNPSEATGGDFFTLTEVRKRRAEHTLNMTPGLQAVMTELDRLDQDGSLSALLVTL